MKLKVSFPHIYIVAFDSQRTSSHRVTKREDGGPPPKTVVFSGNVSTENPEITYGTLVIDEAWWKQQYGKGPFMPGMETAASAAATLVKLTDIFYGCPICSYRTKKLADAEKHVNDHVNKFITQFKIDVEEEDDKTVKE